MSQFPSATIRTTTPKVDLSRDFTGRSYPVPSWFPLTFRDPRKVSSLGGILSIFVLGWFTGEWFISFFVPTNLVLITKDACGVWKWIRDKNDDVYLHGECFQNTKLGYNRQWMILPSAPAAKRATVPINDVATSGCLPVGAVAWPLLRCFYHQSRGKL